MAETAVLIIAKRYARALFSLGKKQGKLEALVQDLSAIAEWMENRGLRRFCRTPIIPRERKAQAFEALLEKAKSDNLTRRFIQQVALADRLSALPAIYKEFSHMVAADKNELQVTISAAQPLTSKQLSALEKALADAYRKTPKLTQITLPSLLAGFIVQVEGRQLDYSLAGKLARLQTILKKTSLQGA